MPLTTGLDHKGLTLNIVKNSIWKLVQILFNYLSTFLLWLKLTTAFFFLILIFQFVVFSCRFLFFLCRWEVGLAFTLLYSRDEVNKFLSYFFHFGCAELIFFFVLFAIPIVTISYWHRIFFLIIYLFIFALSLISDFQP